jgi:hypothetical protein
MTFKKSELLIYTVAEDRNLYLITYTIVVSLTVEIDSFRRNAWGIMVSTLQNINVTHQSHVSEQFYLLPTLSSIGQKKQVVV